MKLFRRLLIFLLLPVVAVSGFVVGALTADENFFTDPSVCEAPSGTMPDGVPPVLNSVFTRAAEQYNTTPYAVALAYFVENRGYVQPPSPYGKGSAWRTSPAGADGPFQFMPGTWRLYRNSNPANKRGNVKDLVDAAYAAAHLLADLGAKGDASIGSLPNPSRGTVLWALGAYNAGPAGNFSNAETAQYLRLALAEYNRTFNIDRDTSSGSTTTQSKSMVQWCAEMKAGSGDSSLPTFGAAPDGSCPTGSLSWPKIKAIGIANPKQGQKIMLCNVGGIVVNAKIATKWQWLIAQAKKQGITLRGGGFRTYAQQIALRKAHCGTSYFAIYKMRANACRPATAIPGTSFHETGLAIDLLGMTQRVYSFMQKYGPKVGIYRTVPSEWWHWSPRTRL